jgi:hypothetical protein
MAFKRITHTPEELLKAFEVETASLLYPSETDAPIAVRMLTQELVGEAFSKEDIERIFYGDESEFEPTDIEWAEANRLESNGTQYFFRDSCNIVTTYPNNEYYVHEAFHRNLAPVWRRLRDLFFDGLVQQRWFRVELEEPNSARFDIYLVGRHLQIEEDPETNETRTELLDWVVLSTHVIET